VITHLLNPTRVLLFPMFMNLEHHHDFAVA
jgi:hypothetical protein